MKKEEFAIAEIRKWAWATTFEKEALKLNGVKSALIDMDKKVLTVEYDEKAIDNKTIRTAIDDVLSRFLNKGFVK